MSERLNLKALPVSHIEGFAPRDRRTSMREGGIAYTVQAGTPMSRNAPIYDDPAHLAAWVAGFNAAITALAKELKESK